MGVALPNVKRINGTLYYVKKIRGKQHYRWLPEVTEAKFPTAYQKAKQSFEKGTQQGDTVPGTFKALIAEYRRSSDYLNELSAETQANYDIYLDMFDAKMGKAPVKDLKTSRVEKMRDEMADTPGKANNWLKVLRALLLFGVRRDYVAVNAAESVKLLKIGEHLPWPQGVVDRALEATKDSPVTRLAIQTGLYSGQRISDCIRITHTMMEGDTVHLIQKKKRSKGSRDIEVFIPIHPLWREAVAAAPARAATILYDRSGRSFKNPEPLQKRIRDLMKELGDVDADGQALYTFHGLRKNSSNYLLEMDLTYEQIGVINGMSPDTVRHYTKGVRRRIVAEGAREKMVASDPANRG